MFVSTLIFFITLTLPLNAEVKNNIKIKSTIVKPLTYTIVSNACFNLGYEYIGNEQGYRDSDVVYNWVNPKNLVSVSMLTSKYEKSSLIITFNNINSINDATKTLGYLLFLLGENTDGIAEMITSCYLCNSKGSNGCKCYKKLSVYNVGFLANPIFQKKSFILNYK